MVSLHGEPEIHEDLVQIFIRDSYCSFFRDYLKIRIKEPGTDWKELARKIKIKEGYIHDIEEKITKERDSLIRKV